MGLAQAGYDAGTNALVEHVAANLKARDRISSPIRFACFFPSSARDGDMIYDL